MDLGASWVEREAVGSGIPFPACRERFERLEETLQIAQQRWSDNPVPSLGRGGGCNFQANAAYDHHQEVRNATTRA